MKKRTPVFEILVTAEKGYHIAPAKKRMSLSRKRRLEAYECMECCFEFRVDTAGCGAYGAQVTCPNCGSLYVEWLSYGTDPQDVYLTTEEEWALVPDGRVVCRPLSTASPAAHAASATSTGQPTSNSLTRTSSGCPVQSDASSSPANEPGAACPSQP